MNIDFCLGLMEGEGCFYYESFKKGRKRVNKEGEIKQYYQNVCKFSICMHVRDFELLQKVSECLGLGKARLYSYHANFAIQGFKNCIKLIELIDLNNGFEGYKNIQYLAWKTKVLAQAKTMQII